MQAVVVADLQGCRRGRICRGVDRHPGYTDEMARRLDSGGKEPGCRRRRATGRVVDDRDEPKIARGGALVRRKEREERRRPSRASCGDGGFFYY